MSIWDYRFIKNSVELSEEEQITLNEGNTKIDSIELSNNSYLFIKREDLNPTGSWKDRGSAYKISMLLKNGIKEAVIASSGNAAISLLTYSNLINDFKLHVVISPNVDSEKRRIIDELSNNKHKIYIQKKAKSFSSKLSAELSIPNLRSALDDEIVKGYWSLGFEIFNEIIKKHRDKKIVIICPVSSGTAAVGLAQGIQLEIENEQNMPKFIFVQTQSCHPLIEEDLSAEEKSLADAIVDQSLLRKPMLKKILNETNGYAVIISNEEILNAHEFLSTKDIKLSNTSALSVAGFLKIYKEEQNTIFITVASGR